MVTTLYGEPLSDWFYDQHVQLWRSAKGRRVAKEHYERFLEERAALQCDQLQQVEQVILKGVAHCTGCGAAYERERYSCSYCTTLYLTGSAIRGA